MKKIVVLVILMVISFNSFCQEKKPMYKSVHNDRKPTIRMHHWKKGLQFSVFAGQAGSKNWASGSDIFSLSANGFVNAFANCQKNKWSFTNMLVASYGIIVTDEFATLKTDDKIDLFSTFGKTLKKNKKAAIGAAFNFRSQFSNGYDRDYLNQGLTRRTSGFFAPAYITVAPVGYILNCKNFSIYATPIGFRGVLVTNNSYSYKYQGGIVPDDMVNSNNPNAKERSVAEMYGVDPARAIGYQVGPYISAGFQKEICKNVNYQGRLDLFSDFTHDNPQNIDIFWSNTFLLKVNNWLHAVYSLDLAYDDDIRKFGTFKDHAALQSKSVLGIGVSLDCGRREHTKNKMKKRDRKTY